LTLFSGTSDARELYHLFDSFVDISLHSYIKRNVPYPEIYRLGPDGRPPPNLHSSTIDTPRQCDLPNLSDFLSALTTSYQQQTVVSCPLLSQTPLLTLVLQVAKSAPQPHIIPNPIQTETSPNLTSFLLNYSQLLPATLLRHRICPSNLFL